MRVTIQRNLWWGFLLAGLVLTGCYALAPDLLGYFIYYGVTFATVVALVAAPFRHRADYRLPWIILAAAMVVNMVADLVWDSYWVLFGLDVPNPSLADPIYFVSFGMIILAFMIWSRWLNPERDRETTIDATIVSLSCTILAWIFIIEPRIYAPGLDFSSQLVSLSYPVFDLFLLTILIRILFRPQGGRQRGILLLVAGTMCIVVSDAIYSWGELTASYTALVYVADSGWLLWSVLWGAAALDPTIAELDRQERRATTHTAGLSRGRFALLCVAALVAPIALAVQPLDGPTLDAVAVAASSALLLALVIYRMYLMLRSLEAAVRRQSELQRDLEFAAFHDPLTGLANRALLNVNLDRVVDQRREQAIGLLFLDLDNFKEINDRLGHAAGDRLLVRVAERLRECIRPQDTIGRIGGDEFVILLRFDGESALETSVEVSERILQKLEAAFPIDGEQVRIGASIGIAWLSDDHVSVDSIMRAADRAMYDAKRAGKNRYSVAPVVAGVGALNEAERDTGAPDAPQFVPLRLPHCA